ncbi:hypothetical protein IWZ01DRAFT_247402 [Phyllosticta capitalensis]
MRGCAVYCSMLLLVPVCASCLDEMGPGHRTGPAVRTNAPASAISDAAVAGWGCAIEPDLKSIRVSGPGARSIWTQPGYCIRRRAASGNVLCIQCERKNYTRPALAPYPEPIGPVANASLGIREDSIGALLIQKLREPAHRPCSKRARSTRGNQHSIQKRHGGHHAATRQDKNGITASDVRQW